MLEFPQSHHVQWISTSQRWLDQGRLVTRDLAISVDTTSKRRNAHSGIGRFADASAVRQHLTLMLPTAVFSLTERRIYVKEPVRRLA